MADNLRAGVIGLGKIGGGIAASLVRSGRIPVVYDVVEDAYKNHEGVPEQLKSAAEVARNSDVIMIAVFNAQQAKSVIADEGGILEGAHSGLVVVLTSTVTVDEAIELSDICKEAGVDFLDCGVSPGSLAAVNGLCAIVGGDEEVVEYARPVIADWSAAIIHCGKTGAGMAAKVARNATTFGVWRVVQESTRMAMAAGIHPSKYLEMVKTLDKTEDLFYNFLEKCAQSEDGKLPEFMRGV